MKENNAKFIFNKYALEYQEKYMDLNLYSGALDLVIDLLEKKNASLLDMGCGPGNITKYLLDKNQDLNILGVDISENMIALARKNNPEADFKVLDCREIYSLNEKFDVILGGFLLPYLNAVEVAKLILDAKGLLKPQGLLYLSTIEAGKTDSGFQVSASDDQDTLYTHYHTLDFLKWNLENNHFEIRHSTYLHNPNNSTGVKDLVLIAAKS